MVYEIAPEGKIKVFEETSDVDFGYEVPGMARYRANFFQQKYGISAVFRLIPSKDPDGRRSRPAAGPEKISAC